MSEEPDDKPELIDAVFRVPVLLRLLARSRRDDGEFKALQDGPGDLDARGRVMSNLITKFLKLDDLAGTLQGALRKTSDPVLYDEIALRKAEVLAEQSLCKARYDAIDAAQPFSDPGPEAQTALLNAIATVDRATATTDAVKALLAAAHELVEAYAAKSTK